MSFSLDIMCDDCEETFSEPITNDENLDDEKVQRIRNFIDMHDCEDFEDE
jgi:hypothetical protein